jgi:hypothetical protein
VARVERTHIIAHDSNDTFACLESRGHCCLRFDKGLCAEWTFVRAGEGEEWGHCCFGMHKKDFCTKGTFVRRVMKSALVFYAPKGHTKRLESQATPCLFFSFYPRGGRATQGNCGAVGSNASAQGTRLGFNSRRLSLCFLPIYQIQKCERAQGGKKIKNSQHYSTRASPRKGKFQFSHI